ncbi:nonsense-mediated mRNA decay factor SMG7-like isoform X2 [Haliotis rufescens]|uniref:nonsense-mediated mRNA decay factor SMG7-like isoform X2 n=1 Tax=Haliotis rufescens TaxID=6454 RepID=UPI00201E9B20|nr:nonsense-mediated mRNA decay factor SMG7-like isoform X2 [Haliotis rufescens]
MATVAQILRQADTLKVTLSESGKTISELWVSRQRLEDLYKKLLLLDLEYALDKKVEQDLWNHAFKNQINILQIQAKDKQNVKRGENQASLNLFLETASGFYLQFLQQICTTFKLDLPFRRKSSAFGVMKEKCSVKNKITTPKKSSCLYVCQHCLVHLGDIARYRQQVEQAQTFYRHAANLVPQNGQPYNQLAILEAARGNKLSTVFYYIRSLAVRHPFPVAATNLEKFYVKLTRDIGDVRGKLSLSEVINSLLQFTALVHLTTDLTKAQSLREHLLSSLPSHVTSQSLTSTVLLQIVAITVFTLSHAQKNIGDQDGEDSQYSREEELCLELITTFTLSVLDVLLQATPKQEQKAREFFTLTPIKVLLDWLHLNPHALRKPQLTESSLWIGLAKLLNSIQSVGDKENPTDMSKFDDIPLPEDCDLRCFQPIEKAHSSYSFSRVPVDGLHPMLQLQIRCHRLLNHGKWLAQQVVGMNLLNCTTLKSGRLQFTTPSIHIRSTAETHTPTGIERKFGRQNVAIQAIIQKKGDHEESESRLLTKQLPSTEKDTKGISQTSSGQSSPKYLLGIPTSEPQFMKHGSVKTVPNQPLYQRYSSPTAQQQPSTLPGPGKFVPVPRVSPSPQVQSNYTGSAASTTNVQLSHLHEQFNIKGHSPPPMQQQPGATSVSQGLSHHTPSPRLPYPKMDMFRMQSPRPGLPQNVTAADVPALPLSPAAQQQLRAALAQTPIPGQPFHNMSPSQLLQVMKLANQMMTTAKQTNLNSQISPPSQQTAFSQAPGTERVQTSPKAQTQHSGTPRMPNFPTFSGTPGYSNVTGAPMRPPPTYGTSNIAPLHKDPGQHPINASMYGGFNPRTIQPPTPVMMETRHTSTFQGHAEGTPKPETFSSDRRDGQNGGGKGVPQSRTYSLFSSSPWEVPSLAGGEPRSLGSSPFSSASSSIRNSPDPESVQTGQTTFDVCYSVPDVTRTGASPNTPASDLTHHQQYGPGNLQSIWSSSGPSPLERLLEQQKQQRQGDPH